MWYELEGVGFHANVIRLLNKRGFVLQNGGALKILATAARLDIEDFVGRKIFLEVRKGVSIFWPLCV